MKFFAVIVMLLWCGVATAGNAQVMEGVRAKLRSGDGENYRTLRVLPARTVVEIIDEGDEFTKVKAQDGQYGWIKSSLLQSMQPASPVAAPAASAPTAAPSATSGKALAPVVEAAQQDLIAAREQLAKMQIELEKERGRTAGEPQLSALLLGALAAFALGMLLGALLLRAYYLKRLRGLRI
ncbi:MAG: SH3 domain-containing protein [Sulfuricellaceae bacterium]